MVETLLKMNRQTGKFQTFYSEDLHKWYTPRLNIRYILITLAVLAITAVCSYLGVNLETGYISPEYLPVVVVGGAVGLCLMVAPLLEEVLYRKVPVEQKQLLDSFVNPYYVFILPISRGGVTYYYMEDSDNAYLLGTKTLCTTCFDKTKAIGGKSYLVVNGRFEPIDFDFSLKTAGDIAEIVRKYSSHNDFRFSNAYTDSIFKTNRLYKAMMTEICS